MLIGQAKNGPGLFKTALWMVLIAGTCDGAETNQVQDLHSSQMQVEPSSRILELFIKKGMLTREEVNSALAEDQAMQANAPPPPESKWKISNAIKKVELFGDLKVRFEDRSVHDPGDGSIELERFRYEARVGLRGEALDNFSYGFRLDTSPNPRSPWVTFGTSASGSPYQGPFGKSTAGVNVGQLYIGWHGLDWLELTVGKMPNPIYTTPMVWDTDFAPEGLAERFKYTVGNAHFFATFGQFLYQDVNPADYSSGYFNLGFTSGNPSFLLAWQGGVDYRFNDNLSLKLAPVLYNYTGHGQNTTPPQFTGVNAIPDFSGTFVGQGSTNGVPNGIPAYYNLAQPGATAFDGFAANQTGINDLLVLEIPWEFNYRMSRFDFRMFGDYAMNLQGSDRAKAAYAAQQSPLYANSGLIRIPSPQTDDTKAIQAGIGIGSKDSLGLVYGTGGGKHSWEVRTYFQRVEQYALDPNLLDSDFFEGRGNLEGIYAAVAYAVSGNVIATFRYGYAWRINDKLGTGGSNQDIPQMNPIQRFNLLQLDLSLRF
jgi:hypothetical protein